ncbi:DUF4382 domain-containing protein [Cyanobacterium stanieri LEGE 03274]|uniref:DUF4382 domain-containing protein n=1 Tax=Cyanobacterium stanieri LEGE 03274 TaxID=1828756 RepID=A0ABR9V5Y9_9CHRO|nr:DUF4382 domain-containing protein [Cyanobacterium stanieri]MBE9223282.1 DUF4382 domain-containing protein [Cyanobacterium stanieri LEGE 03274]
MIKTSFPSIPKIFVLSAIALTITGCNPPQTNTPENNPPTPEVGFLQLTANGQNYIFQEIQTKDGWNINLNHVYITINNVIAHQTNPPYNASTENPLQAQESVNLIISPTTIDLMLGTMDNPAVLVTEVEAPPGDYNALSWQMYNNPESPPSLSLEGIAQKDNQQIPFTLQLPMDINYTCGDFVGDETKGILNPGETAEIEMTFNLNHIFGDARKDNNDAINLTALGFQPIANLANNQPLETNLENLKTNLTPEQYQTLENNILQLAQVGEGQCRYQL